MCNYKSLFELFGGGGEVTVEPIDVVTDSTAKISFSNGISYSQSVSGVHTNPTTNTAANPNITKNYSSTSETFKVQKGQVLEWSTSISFTNQSVSIANNGGSVSSSYSWNPQFIIIDSDNATHVYSIKNDGNIILEYSGTAYVKLELSAWTTRNGAYDSSDSTYAIGRSGFSINYTTKKIVVK